jgi:hypothetical protein
MSATNRGAQRLADDFYSTPEWATRAILREIGPLAPSRVLEPCAGTGAIVKVVREFWPSTRLEAVDIDPLRTNSLVGAGATHARCADFLSLTPGPRAFDLCITNPPFSLAMEVIEHSRRFARDVVMLLRLNFLGSQDRAAFFSAHPCDLRTLSRRPSFAASVRCVGVKKATCSWTVTIPLDAPRPKLCPVCQRKVTVTTSDATEYAWFWWGPGRGGQWSVLDLEEEAAE